MIPCSTSNISSVIKNERISRDTRNKKSCKILCWVFCIAMAPECLSRLITFSVRALTSVDSLIEFFYRVSGSIPSFVWNFTFKTFPVPPNRRPFFYVLPQQKRNYKSTRIISFILIFWSLQDNSLIFMWK